MKKITNNEDKAYEYNNNLVNNDYKVKNNHVPDDEKGEEPIVNTSYKIVDPKKRMQMYIILAIAAVLIVVLIVANQVTTSTQKSKVVESVSYSETNTESTEEKTSDTENSTKETNAETTTEEMRVVPIYSISGNWKTDKSNYNISFDDNGSFTYNWKVSDKSTVKYKGTYSIKAGRSAYEAAKHTLNDVSNSLHIDNDDIVEANLLYVDCKATEYSIDGGPFKPVQISDDEENDELFTQLLYLTTDSKNNVIAKYYDELTKTVVTLNHYE